MYKIRNQDVAIIGISIRFPGAKNHNIFWKNLCENVESIIFSNKKNKDGENENYVNAKAIIENIDLFDAKFFGFNRREAEFTDPQHRIFLECSIECFEDAGYNPSLIGTKTSVFAGTNMSSYFINNLNPIYNPDNNQNFLLSTNNLRIMIGNDKDYLPTKVSYKLNLQGPSVNVQTACSTSLVAIHMACNSLINHESNFALAGAVNIQIPQSNGYIYQEGMILSPDGHCKAFDSDAKGTIFGNGVGVVLLKLAKQAIRDNDNIYAIIKGTAINNDGIEKMSFSAPSSYGQISVIKQALSKSGLFSEDISFVEAHGTGTTMGDPIEVAALSKAFATNKKRYCALGSVKTNIGHLGWAAGMAGLVKVTLALKHKKIPATLHFKNPNSLIGIEDTPFFVNSKLLEWVHNNGNIRHAAVSSFGIGGTNAHIILSEYKEIEQEIKNAYVDNQKSIFLISAKTKKALNDYCLLFYNYLKTNNKLSLLDLCFTVNESRGFHEIKKAFKINSIEDLSNQLLNFTKIDSSSNHDKQQFHGKLAFLFGTNHFSLSNLEVELYQKNKVFKEALDECSKIFYKLTNKNLIEILFANISNREPIIYKKSILFALEVSIAKLWISLNIIPNCVIGYGLGNISATCISKILTIEEGLRITVEYDRISSAIDAVDIRLKFLNNLKPILSEINFKKSEFYYINICMDEINEKAIYNLESWQNYLIDNSISDKAFNLLTDIGVEVFLEITPKEPKNSPFTTYYNNQSLVLPALNPNHDMSDQILDTIIELCYTKINFNWKEFFLNKTNNYISKISLPTYPFQRERFWLGNNE
ncbi:MAG: type I polyketide synthase [Arcobacter sp.]|nr:type I polyketide synthase [Arcobacter sp.]